VKRLGDLVSVFVVLSFLLSGCSGLEQLVSGLSGSDVLYVNLVWHQHQPLYYKDKDGVYTRPWVRVHATKDYYDMASTLAKYPDVHATINLTPVLLRQLDDFTENDAKDLYWVLAEKPADRLTEDEKRFILERFFDANWTNMIARFPRYQALLEKRGGTDADDINRALETFDVQDIRDLQIWFNLAWFDPDFLAEEPLKWLVEKGGNFSEEDKQIVFDQVRDVMQEIVPLHRQMQEAGQIEVITTPYAHPILPLIFNSQLALTGNPSAEMPPRFSWPNDAIAHLQRSVEIYEQHFGQPPRGLWPGEGAVAEEIVPLVNQAGYQWMATGEPVLAKSLGIGDFTRNNQDTVQEADALYRPYMVSAGNGEKVAVFFRDWVISDKLGFEYSQTPGKEAAEDLILRLENIKARLREENAKGPHVVSIILDGENAWEYYPNDGKEFLNEMYRLLSETKGIQTITPSAYLEKYPKQEDLDELFPGAWFSPNYDTWIGEPEETLAWDYLGRVREHLAKYDVKKQRSVPEEQLALALDFMYLAEGSDWFWWYGADQDSGQDEYFDLGFRSLLKGVYTALGDPVPVFLEVPIIARRPVEPRQSIQELGTPVVDGDPGDADWEKAAIYDLPEGTLSVLLDQENLYLLLESKSLLATGEERLHFYISAPGGGTSYPFAFSNSGQPDVQLGISATHLFMRAGEGIDGFLAKKDGWEPVRSEADVDMGSVGAEVGVVEMRVPVAAIGELYAGDTLQFVVVLPDDEKVIPEGPVKIVLPDMGNSVKILEIFDPEGDDFGPGNYTYPNDGVFSKQVFDIQSFSAAFDERNLIFTFQFYGAVPNPWGSTIGLSLQTLDIYVDQDPGSGSGARLLLPGRNAALGTENGWEIAILAEGWYPDIFEPDPASGAPKSVGITPKISVDAGKQSVTIRVPREAFGEGDPRDWGYAAMVMSQDGFPSKGVWRIRDVEPVSSQWRLGGASGHTNQTRIIDMVWPSEEGLSQEDILSSYASSSLPLDQLGADDFAQLPVLRSSGH
jgi:alpha-amylase/alpha-mannosidase (GH57 family)